MLRDLWISLFKTAIGARWVEVICMRKILIMGRESLIERPLERAHRCHMVNARAERQAARSVTEAAVARKRFPSHY